MRLHTVIACSLLLAAAAAAAQEFVPIEEEFTEGKEAAEQVQKLISESILKPFAEKYQLGIEDEPDATDDTDDPIVIEEEEEEEQKEEEKEEGQYVLGEGGDINCPQGSFVMTSTEDCREAAEQYGFTFQVSSSTYRARGCVVHDARDAHFSPNGSVPDSTFREDAQLFCKKDGTLNEKTNVLEPSWYDCDWKGNKRCRDDALCYEEGVNCAPNEGMCKECGEDKHRCTPEELKIIYCGEPKTTEEPVEEVEEEDEDIGSGEEMEDGSAESEDDYTYEGEEEEDEEDEDEGMGDEAEEEGDEEASGEDSSIDGVQDQLEPKEEEGEKEADDELKMKRRKWHPRRHHHKKHHGRHHHHRHRHGKHHHRHPHHHGRPHPHPHHHPHPHPHHRHRHHHRHHHRRPHPRPHRWNCRAHLGQIIKPKFCGKSDCPAYNLTACGKGYEKRCYGPTTWVTTSADKLNTKWFKPMFMRLFKYIQGANEDKQKIKMTVPVMIGMDYNDTTHKTKSDMAFYLPMTSPPKPTGAKVSLHSCPSGCAYVRSFGGRVRGRSLLMYKHLYLLTKALKNDKIAFAKGKSVFAGYDSPWKRMNRHNEVWRWEETDKVEEETEEEEEEENVWRTTYSKFRDE